jgi:short-chain Z-isoprenyl diphosphate synthase
MLAHRAQRSAVDRRSPGCADLGVPRVTLWVFSTDNLDRPVEQVSGILSAIEAKVRTLTHHPKVHDRRVRVQAIGKLERLPSSLVAVIRAAQEATAFYDGMTLTIAVAYGGRDEIVDAVRGLPVDQHDLVRPVEGRACPAVPQPDAVRASLSARDPGDGVRRAQPRLCLLQGDLHARHLRQHEDGGRDPYSSARTANTTAVSCGFAGTT